MWYSSTTLISFTGENPHNDITSCLLGLLSAEKGLWSLAKELCKIGCPVGHRRELWCRTLALDTTEPEVRCNGFYKG